MSSSTRDYRNLVNTQNPVERVKFRDNETEAIVLADILQYPKQLSAYRTAGLTSSHFDHGVHVVLVDAITQLEQAGVEPDPAQIRRVLLERGTWDEGIASYVYTTLPQLGVPRQAPPNISHNVTRLDCLRRCREIEALARRRVAQLAEQPDAIDNGFIPNWITALEAQARTPATATLFRTAPEFAAATPDRVPWVAKPYVAAGAITELVAAVKRGKTTLALCLAGSVVHGWPFLGEPVVQGAVVYLTEQHTTSFREALRRAGLLDCELFSILSYWAVVGRPWPEITTLAIREAGRLGARLLVVDTLTQFAGLKGDSENDAGAALAAMEPLQHVAAKGLGVVVVRHERKSGGEVGHSGRGSSAFAGAADIVIALRRPEGNTRPGLRVLEALSRFEETPATLVIERILPAGARERVQAETFTALGSAGAVAALEAEGALFAGLPRASEHAQTLDEFLQAHRELKRTAVQAALTRLVENGRVQRLGEGKRGNPYRYFKPVAEEAT